MTCSEVFPLLDEFADGSLDAGRAAGVAGHLAGCAACRSELAAIQTLLAAARALPRAVHPDRELWPGIEARLFPRRATRPHRQRPRALLALAAGIALLLAGALLATWYQRTTAPAASAFALERQRYDRESADLAQSLGRDSTGLPGDTRAVVQRNLAIVDRAIREAEAALASDPGNAELEQMILARYAQRLALLKRATEAGRRES
jgi:Putative zinc-finger